MKGFHFFVHSCAKPMRPVPREVVFSPLSADANLTALKTDSGDAALAQVDGEARRNLDAAEESESHARSLAQCDGNFDGGSRVVLG